MRREQIVRGDAGSERAGGIGGGETFLGLVDELLRVAGGFLRGARRTEGDRRPAAPPPPFDFPPPKNSATAPASPELAPSPPPPGCDEFAPPPDCDGCDGAGAEADGADADGEGREALGLGLGRAEGVGVAEGVGRLFSCGGSEAACSYASGVHEHPVSRPSAVQHAPR
jgi:hypothetical protein